MQTPGAGLGTIDGLDAVGVERWPEVRIWVVCHRQTVLDPNAQPVEDHCQEYNVERGSFRLKLVVGSRQWGGADYHLNLELGRWDELLNEHVGGLRWGVSRATEDETADPAAEKVAAASVEIVNAWHRRRDRKRTPWKQAECFERSNGTTTVLRVAWHQLVESTAERLAAMRAPYDPLDVNYGEEEPF